MSKQTIKTVILFPLLLLVFLSGSPNSFAASPAVIGVTLDGENVPLDVPPTVVNGRTLVPLRAIFESLGAKVEWDGATKTIRGTKQNTSITLQIDNKTAYVNNQPYTLDVPATIMLGRTLVPMRFIAESLGAKINWLGKTKTVEILTQEPVKIIDPNLEAVIREIIGKPADEIYTRDVKKISFLDLSEKKISSLEGIQHFVNVKEIDLSKNTITDISPLIPLQKLSFLNISENKISNFMPLNNLKELAVLNAGAAFMGDLSPIRDLTNLKELHLFENNLSDITHLSNFKNLTILNLHTNAIKDLSPLKNLEQLTELYLGRNQIIDITPLSALKKLKILYLGENQIYDTSPLAALYQLTTLDIYYNPIIDLSVFKALPMLQSIIIESFGEKTRVGQELFKKYDDMLSKAREIVKTVIKPGMTDLEKEMAFHDYIVNHTKYDTENYEKDTIPNAAHAPEGVLLNGSAVCDGYARTMQILCNMAGLECLLVIGEGYGKKGWEAHAWNMIKMNGIYYHLDPTFNDPTQNERNVLSHFYFNVSDKQMASSHKWNKKDYPPCSNDSQDFNRTISLSKSMVFINNDLISVEENHLRKVDFTNFESQKMLEGSIKNLATDGVFLYYINESEGKKLYKMKPDGTQKSVICDEPVDLFEIYGGNLFCISGEKTFRISSEGANKITIATGINTSLYVLDQWVYYKSYTWYAGSGFFKVGFDGQGNTPLNNIKPSGFILSPDGNEVEYYYGNREFIIDQWIYYINSDDKNSIYRLHLTQGENQKLNSDESDEVEIAGNWVYYINKSDGNKYYRVKTDGTAREEIH
ncbi:MAG: stalk domain-containing protein [Clostridia bacterium]|nr:stalk domain-containing protein [Clostridia bacterium]